MELWHLINRGVEKRAIVTDDKDRVRFIHDLYAFNDARRVEHIAQPGRAVDTTSTGRDLLVRIHAYCLMNNHYHILVSEEQDGGISKFMQKLNMGYAKYFNERHERTAGLWQGKYRKVLIKRDAHFMYVPYYIHLNPLDYAMPEWRKGKVRDKKKIFEILNAYRWSSHIDYLGEKNFSSVLDMRLLKEVVRSPAHYQREILRIVSHPGLAVESESIELA